MSNEGFTSHTTDVLAWLGPKLEHLREKAPQLFRATHDLGSTGLVLARPVWAAPERKLAKIAEPLIAAAALLSLTGALLTGLISLFGLLSALTLVFALLHFVFGIRLDMPNLAPQT